MDIRMEGTFSSDQSTTQSSNIPVDNASDAAIENGNIVDVISSPKLANSADSADEFVHDDNAKLVEGSSSVSKTNLNDKSVSANENCSECKADLKEDSDADEKTGPTDSVDAEPEQVEEEAGEDNDNCTPVKKRKLELEKDVIEELPFAYFEKRSTTSTEQTEPVLSKPVNVLCVQKAEASKRSKESKESRDFRCLITSSENFKGWRLQEGPCAEAYYSPCLICSLNKNRKDKSDCRFYNRMLRSIENPKECRRLTIADARFFIDETKASTSSSVNAKDFWRTNATGGKRRVTRLSKTVQPHKLERNDSHFAAYILQCVKREYEKIVERENRILQLDCTADGVFFSHSCNCDQICDVCDCSIFNAHYCCVICGVELCWLCYEELVKPSSGSHGPEWLQRLKCLNGVEHLASMFHLGSFLPIPDLYKKTLKKVNEQFVRYRVHSNGSTCNGNHGRRYFQEEKCYCPRLCSNIKVQDRQVCRIKDYHEAEAIATFKTHLSLHIPIIVEGVNEHPDFYPAVWSREAFEKIVSGQKKLHVLDCQTLRQAYLDGKMCSTTQFWKRFDSVHVDGEPYLKIKDFPETAMFGKVAPQQYANYFTILPFLDYTQVNLKDHEKGKLNLLNVFEEQDGLTDPGPKAYIAVGLCKAPDLASAPLHMDVSDSVSFLAVVQPPKELSRGELSKAIGERLTLEGIQADEKSMLLKRPDKVGAIWKVFHPDDTDRLRAAIIEWKQINGEKIDGDVIYNQDVVITLELMDFLKKKDIRCYVFIQCEGDVVFVPSGCAHQVQNISSCIKVAEDFVAVEGIEYIVKLSDDFRRLKHGNDLIRIDTVLHRACSAAVETLSKSEPCLVSSSV